ncbi:MAG: uroporphyrinogen-III synthase [Betaproteobacteria bacterium]
MTSPDRILGGHAILVTRPERQAAGLARLLRERGAEPVLFPTIEIRAASDPEPLRRALGQLRAMDLVVFASANAVAHAWPAIVAAGGLAIGTAVMAIGEGTAAALTEAGCDRVVTPAEGADSEALLATSALQDVTGRRIAIFSGSGGRELLADTLRARGACVEKVPCYARGRPALDPAPIRARLACGALSAIIATSSEGVDNLYAMLAADVVALARLPHVVPHQRIAATLRRHGADLVTVTRSGDAALVDALPGVLALRVQADPLHST